MKKEKKKKGNFEATKMVFESINLTLKQNINKN